jgi:hypothetical protein
MEISTWRGHTGCKLLLSFMRADSRVIFIKQQKLCDLSGERFLFTEASSWRHSSRLRGLLVTRSQLKSDLLRGWIDNHRMEIRYGLPEEKT